MMNELHTILFGISALLFLIGAFLPPRFPERRINVQSLAWAFALAGVAVLYTFL